MISQSEKDWWDTDITGYLSTMVDPRSSIPAATQFKTTYAHGGGWMPFDGFTLHDFDKPGHAKMTYPDDPPMKEIARLHMIGTPEIVIMFPHAWVAVVQPSGSFEISRMD